MTTASAAGPRTSRAGRAVRTLGRDLGYLVPGTVLAIVAFAVLLALFVTGVATFVVWIGAVILPLCLVVATGFAQISRARLRVWGADVTTPRYREHRGGLGGWFRLLADPRRWLDLLYEGLLAFPLRLFTGLVAIIWPVTALGGLTYWFWGLFLPEDDAMTGVEWLLLQLPDGWVSQSFAESFAADAILTGLAGLVFLLTTPWVVRLMALMDAGATTVALAAPPATTATGGQQR
ncbi:sensor domain-containing protein [Georgenia sp. Z1491]|uniref:sensor domain-containing protein n=1 Tax=Georgenia sp. Z1491 TaxID=3416707 RepID=UPI003CF28220